MPAASYIWNRAGSALHTDIRDTLREHDLPACQLAFRVLQLALDVRQHGTDVAPFLHPVNDARDE